MSTKNPLNVSLRRLSLRLLYLPLTRESVYASLLTSRNHTGQESDPSQHVRFSVQRPASELESSSSCVCVWNFRGSSLRCTMPEKESYAVIASFTRLAHILVSGGEFSIFTDHENILYMLSPTRIQGNLTRHIVQKVQRWAI